jgi:hypothetical protein
VERNKKRGNLPKSESQTWAKFFFTSEKEDISNFPSYFSLKKQFRLFVEFWIWVIYNNN